MVPDSDSRLDHPELISPSLLRTLPIVNTLSLESTTSDRLNTLLQMLPQPRDVVILLDPKGECLWASCDYPAVDSVIEVAAHVQNNLRQVLLTQNLRANAPGDVMDQGL